MQMRNKGQRVIHLAHGGSQAFFSWPICLEQLPGAPGSQLTWSQENSAPPPPTMKDFSLTFGWPGPGGGGAVYLPKICPEVWMGCLQAILLCDQFLLVPLLEDTIKG